MNENNAFYARALELNDEIIRDRRTVHGFAEIGFDIPKTYAYVTERLRSFGYEPRKVGKAGITCTVGKAGGKVILLRGDMDALPMAEESGLPFAAQNGHCHSCGHDCHTTMLLTAARLLKEREDELQGMVKFMFQPAEELLAGAKDMIENGILENPHVDVGMGMHIAVGREQNCHVGEISYSRGPANYSGDAIRITVEGRDAHGSTPFLGVDAISIASHIVIALQEILAREIPCTEHSVLIVGKIEGGTTCNTLAGTAVLECSARTTTAENREHLKQRVREIAESTAHTFRGKANVEFVYGMPPMVTDPELSDELAGYCAEIVPAEGIRSIPASNGSEDFTAVAAEIPTAFFHIGAGAPEDGHTGSLHNPHMFVDEKVLPIGAALYANAAMSYLAKHH